MIGQRPPKGFGFRKEVPMSNLRVYIEEHKKLVGILGLLFIVVGSCDMAIENICKRKLSDKK